MSRQLLSSNTGGSGGVVRVSSGHQHSQTKELPIPSTTSSSAEYIVKGIKQHKKVALIAVGVIVAALVAFYYYNATRPIDSIAVLPFPLQLRAGR